MLKRAKQAAGHLVKIEIEVDSLDQLKEVLDVGLADVVLIDNFDLDAMRKAVAMVAGRLVIEASGGITLDSAAAIAETGVDYLSSGALTHSVIISMSGSISRCSVIRARHFVAPRK